MDVSALTLLALWCLSLLCLILAAAGCLYGLAAAFCAGRYAARPAPALTPGAPRPSVTVLKPLLPDRVRPAKPRRPGVARAAPEIAARFRAFAATGSPRVPCAAREAERTVRRDGTASQCSALARSPM